MDSLVDSFCSKCCSILLGMLQWCNTLRCRFGALEQQGATINEISRNVSEVSTSADEVAGNVAESASGLKRCIRSHHQCQQCGKRNHQECYTHY